MKKRKHKIRFGSAPSSHISDANAAFRHARESIRDMGAATSCAAAFGALVNATGELAVGYEHRHAAVDSSDYGQLKSQLQSLDAIYEPLHMKYVDAKADFRKRCLKGR